jgi:hypothetical protein
MEKVMLSYNDLSNAKTLTYRIANQIHTKFVRAQEEANRWKELDIAFANLLQSKKEISFDDWHTIAVDFQNTGASAQEIINVVFNKEFT